MEKVIIQEMRRIKQIEKGLDDFELTKKIQNIGTGENVK